MVLEGLLSFECINNVSFVFDEMCFKHQNEKKMKTLVDYFIILHDSSFYDSISSFIFPNLKIGLFSI